MRDLLSDPWPSPTHPFSDSPHSTVYVGRTVAECVSHGNDVVSDSQGAMSSMLLFRLHEATRHTQPNVIPAKERHPVPRYGAGIQRGEEIHLTNTEHLLQSWRDCHYERTPPLPMGFSFRLRFFSSYAPLLPFPAHTVSMTVLGFMGRRVIRTPIAWLMALAIAAGGGTMLTSPTPRTPNG